MINFDDITRENIEYIMQIDQNFLNIHSEY